MSLRRLTEQMFFLFKGSIRQLEEKGFVYSPFFFIDIKIPQKFFV